MTVARRLAVALGLMAFAITMTSCGNDRYRTLSVGTCLPSTARVEGDREPDPPTVSCDAEHRYEVYRVTGIGLDGSYPGEQRVDDEAEKMCFVDFESAVGVAPQDLPDEVKQVIISPTEQSWNGQSDREVECLLRFDADRTGRLAGGT